MQQSETCSKHRLKFGQAPLWATPRLRKVPPFSLQKTWQRSLRKVKLNCISHSFSWCLNPFERQLPAHINIYILRKHNMIICGAKNYALQRNTVQCLLQVRSFPSNDEVCYQQFTNASVGFSIACHQGIHPRRFLAPPLKHWKLNLGLKQG